MIAPASAMPERQTTSADITIDLYVWHLDAPAPERAALNRLLSADETERAARFVFERDRYRYAVARGRLREILASYTGYGAAGLTFQYGPQGKPALSAETPGPHFNLSHSDDLACLAVSWSIPVGADIERVRPVEPGLAERFFSPAEVAELAALHDHDRLDGFFRCWTRKEAFLKAIGIGLSQPLDSFDISLSQNKPPKLLRLDGDPDAPRRWWLGHLRPAEGAIVAVAAPACGANVQLNRIL